MRKSIAIFAMLFCAAFLTKSACADVASHDYPCDGSEGYWLDDTQSTIVDTRDGVDRSDDDLVEIGRVVAFFDPGQTVPDPDGLIGYKDGHYRVPGAYYVYLILCDGAIVDAHYTNTEVGINPFLYATRIPNWGYPFVIQQTVTQTNGHTVTQIFSASGFLAVNIDYDGVSGSAVFTTYPNPLE